MNVCNTLISFEFWTVGLCWQKQEKIILSYSPNPVYYNVRHEIAADSHTWDPEIEIFCFKNGITDEAIIKIVPD